MGQGGSKLEIFKPYNSLYVNQNRTDSFDIDDLLKFIFAFETYPQISNFDAKRIKDEKLFEIFNRNSATVIFFAPRLLLRGEKYWAFILRDLIGRNFDCGRSLENFGCGRSLANFDQSINSTLNVDWSPPNCSGTNCRFFEKLIDWLGYTVELSIFDEKIDNFSKLACGFNRTMRFLMVDSGHNEFLPQNLGLKLSKNGFGVAIVDKD
uniref:Uncharacterized protein n=1 Tax=Romanomermis culicivorax TaxID=13658 RepID=A0A915IDC7_ROMCU